MDDSPWFLNQKKIIKFNIKMSVKPKSIFRFLQIPLSPYQNSNDIFHRYRKTGKYKSKSQYHLTLVRFIFKKDL